MIHIRIDDSELNKDARFLCGLGPGIDKLPEGDRYISECESYGGLLFLVDCEGCGGPTQIGTPISELSGQPGHPGYAEFCRIARSWGYE